MGHFLGFSTTIHDPRTGELTGVVCTGECGAPCWMADALATAQGRRPTLDERLESVCDQLGNALAPMHGTGTGPDLVGEFAGTAGEAGNPLLAQGFPVVREALSGASMLADRIARGTRDTGAAFEDYLNPIAAMLRGAGFYLELDYDHDPAIRSWGGGTDRQVAALDRIRHLMVELGHQLDIAQSHTTDARDRLGGAGITTLPSAGRGGA